MVLAASIALALFAALFAGGDTRRCLMVVAVLQPLVVLQDVLRLLMITQGRQRAAAANDFVWFILIVALVPLAHQGRFSPAIVLGMWMAGGAIAAVSGLIQVGRLPAGSLRGWRADARGLTHSLFADSVLSSVYGYLAGPVVGAMAGLSASAHLRIAQSALGPQTVLTQAIRLNALPEMSRMWPREGEQLLRSARVRTSVLVASASALAGVFIVLPDQLGEMLFGPTWVDARMSVRLMTVWAIVAALGDISVTAVKAASGASRVLRVRIFAVPFQMLAIGVGSKIVGSANGAIVTMIASNAALAAIWWVMLYRAVRPNGALHRSGARGSQ